MQTQRIRSTCRLATVLVAILLLSPLFELHSHADDQGTSPVDVYQDCAICAWLASAAPNVALPTQAFASTCDANKGPTPVCVPCVGYECTTQVSYLSRAPPIALF